MIILDIKQTMLFISNDEGNNYNFTMIQVNLYRNTLIIDYSTKNLLFDSPNKIYLQFDFMNEAL